MHGKLYREWSLFLKERKLYSKFMMHYQIANINSITWGGRNELNFNILNGKDYIMPNKGDSLTFPILLSCMRIIDWYLPSTTISWSSLATEFGERKGYIQKKENNSNLYGYYEVSSTSTVHNPNRRHRRVREEVYTKWYDRYYIDTVKNRHRR